MWKKIVGGVIGGGAAGAAGGWYAGHKQAKKPEIVVVEKKMFPLMTAIKVAAGAAVAGVGLGAGVVGAWWHRTSRVSKAINKSRLHSRIKFLGLALEDTPESLLALPNGESLEEAYNSLARVLAFMQMEGLSISMRNRDGVLQHRSPIRVWQRLNDGLVCHYLGKGPLGYMTGDVLEDLIDEINLIRRSLIVEMETAVPSLKKSLQVRADSGRLPLVIDPERLPDDQPFVYDHKVDHQKEALIVSGSEQIVPFLNYKEVSDFQAEEVKSSWLSDQVIRMTDTLLTTEGLADVFQCCKESVGGAVKSVIK